MKKRIKYTKTAPQAEFHDDIKTKILLFSGGLGSGKTYGLCMKMIQLSSLNRNMPGGLLCPSYQDYKKDILPTFMDIDERNKIGIKIHNTDKTFFFPWTKAPLYIFTAEKPIAGPNLAYCGVNEYSLMQEERVNEMMRRVRVKRAKNAQRCLAGTPEDVYGWLEEFIEKQTESGRLRIIHSKTTDNTHLDPDYVEHLRATLDPQAFKLFAEGHIISLGGDLFYYAFSDKNVKDVERQKGQLVYINVDFNVGNMTATFAHVVGSGQGKEVHFFDEVVLTGYDDDTYTLRRRLLELFEPEEVLITCDASGKARKTTGKSDVNVLKEVGFNVRYRYSGNPRLRQRQLLVNGLMANDKIFINKHKCKTLYRDFRRVKQDINNFEKIKKDPKLTHASDTADYLINFEFELVKRESFSSYKLF